MNCTIRNMIKSDIESLSHGFMNQGWPGREEILARYFLEQESGEREVLVAEIDGAVAGYVTIFKLNGKHFVANYLWFTHASALRPLSHFFV